MNAILLLVTMVASVLICRSPTNANVWRAIQDCSARSKKATVFLALVLTALCAKIILVLANMNVSAVQVTLEQTAASRLILV